jgi:hypothetical protein
MHQEINMEDGFCLEDHIYIYIYINENDNIIRFYFFLKALHDNLRKK